MIRCNVSPDAKSTAASDASSAPPSSSRDIGSMLEGVLISADICACVMEGPSSTSAESSLLIHSVQVNVSPTWSVPNDEGRVRSGERMKWGSKWSDLVARAANGLILNVEEGLERGSGVCCERDGLDSLGVSVQFDGADYMCRPEYFEAD